MDTSSGLLYAMKYFAAKVDGVLKPMKDVYKQEVEILEHIQKSGIEHITAKAVYWND